MKKVISTNSYTWIHMWPPWCHSGVCENINYFEQASDKLKDKGVEFLLVSVSYDLGEIKNKLANSQYNKPIFVLQDSYYGRKIDKARIKFFNEFKNSQTPVAKYGFSDYFFHDTILIYGGDHLTAERIDSLINKQL